MKNIKAPLLIVICVLFAIGFIVLVMKLSSGYLDHTTPAAQKGCSPHSKNHKVVIQNDKAVPAHTTAPKCDTLTITNLDSEERIMAFGPHEDHVPYDGVAERLLSKGQSFTVTLNQTGNFRFHDHIHDEVQGTFTVTN